MNCNRCKTHKPRTEFHKDSSRKSGYRNVCKTCRSKPLTVNDQAAAKVSEFAKIFAGGGSLLNKDIDDLIELNKKITHPPDDVIKINGAMIPVDDKINYIKSKALLYLAQKNISTQIISVEKDIKYRINNEIYIRLDKKIEHDQIERIQEFLVDAEVFNEVLLNQVTDYNKLISISQITLGITPNIEHTNSGVKIIWSKNYALNREEYQKLVEMLSSI
jgi:hypothetical protein